MPHNLEVIHQPDHRKTNSFMVYAVGEEELSKWRKDPSSIALVEVYDGKDDVFFSNQGAQGKWGQASRQELEDAYGTKNKADVIETILRKGQAQVKKVNVKSDDYNSRNDADGARSAH